jgi:uncharacterized protein (TIGR03118 family)
MTAFGIQWGRQGWDALPAWRYGHSAVALTCLDWAREKTHTIQLINRTDQRKKQVASQSGACSFDVFSRGVARFLTSHERCFKEEGKMLGVRSSYKFVVVAVLAVSAFPGLTCAQHYMQKNLVSDIAGMADVRDGNLVNPWGLTRSTGSPFWVGNNGTGTSTLYNGAGAPFPLASPLVVTIPTTKKAPPGTTGTPTGVVFNGSSDFELAPKMPAVFIFVTEDGTISGWNPNVDPTNAIRKVDRADKAVYKGATIGEHNGKRYIYVANFRAGQIEVYDTTFTRVHAFDEAFTDDDHDNDADDRHSQRGFAPFNIQNVGGNLVVAYALQDSAKKDEVDGTGLGFVNIFSSGGKFLAQLQNGDWFNAPWGVALAPEDFGEFSHSLLIGNFGSGKIVAFNPVTFQFRGFMKNADETPIVIDGLWSLVFGNSANAGPYNSLFFTAGIQQEQHGLFGALTAVTAEQDGDEL